MTKLNPLVRELIELGNKSKGIRVGSKDFETVKKNVSNAFNTLKEKNNDRKS